jgi:hypothetical protein
MQGTLNAAGTNSSLSAGFVCMNIKPVSAGAASAPFGPPRLTPVAGR